MAILNYKYKLYVNSKKNCKLSRLITSGAFIWNEAIRLSRKFYKFFKRSLKNSILQKYFAKLAKIHPYWKDLSSQTIQAICQKYQQALDAKFKNKRGFPKLHNPHKENSIVFKQAGYRLVMGDKKKGYFYINKISKNKPFRFKCHRPFGKIKRILVKRDNFNQFWLIVTTDVNPKSFKRVNDSAIGIDFGLKTFLTLSDGNFINQPDFLNKSYQEISKCCKNISHKYEAKVFGSSFKRSKKALNKAYIDLVNKREEFQWKLAHQLCRENKLIALETLNLKGMAKKRKVKKTIDKTTLTKTVTNKILNSNKNKRKLALKSKKGFGKKISMLSFSSFVEKLKYVAIKYGTIIHQIDKFAPSSQLCNNCGNKNPITKNLSIREWKCDKCGNINDRDINAAKNILDIALNKIKEKSKGMEAFLCQNSSNSIISFKNNSRYVDDIRSPLP